MLCGTDGSQVTIVFESWYSRNLPDVPVHPLAGLSIWGLSSCSYPYQGYIVIDVTFPVILTGAEETLSILALVKSSQVTFIYIAPLTIQIVTKHCTISK